MTSLQVDFAGSEESIATIIALAEREKVDNTGAMDAGSNVEGLNAPITGADIMLAAQVVTAIFNSGAAIVAFVIAVRAALGKSETISIKVGGKKFTLTKDTPDEEIGKIES